MFQKLLLHQLRQLSLYSGSGTATGTGAAEAGATGTGAAEAGATGTGTVDAESNTERQVNLYDNHATATMWSIPSFIQLIMQ